MTQAVFVHEFALNYPGFVYDPGTGKTRVVFDLCRPAVGEVA